LPFPTVSLERHESHCAPSHHIVLTPQQASVMRSSASLAVESDLLTWL